MTDTTTKLLSDSDPGSDIGGGETGHAPRVALVTGASGAIGAAAAEALAASGHAVAVAYRSDGDAAAEVVERITSAGGWAVAVELDVTDPASVDAALEEVRRQAGPVTVLVNNAGCTDDGLFIRGDDQRWRAVIDANLDGAARVTRRVVPAMLRARWGRIVNVSSVVALSGSAGQVDYAAAKAGLIGFSRSLARELATRAVTVNVVTPGPIATPMLEATGDARMAELARAVPAGRLGQPSEVAAVVGFLCSDAAAYVNGAVVPVDGGLGMGH